MAVNAAMENHSSIDNFTMQINSSPAVSKNLSASEENPNGPSKGQRLDLIGVLKDNSSLIPYLILTVALISLFGTWRFVWSKKTHKNDPDQTEPGENESECSDHDTILDMPASDELPERADLPPGSLVPFYPNAVFTGRQEDLLNLASDLLHSGIRAVGLTQAAAVATGYGGIGKTQLAVEFCYRYGRYFQGVHWISADLDILAEISACGEAMGLSPWPEELPERVRATLNALNDGQPRLVVLDNVTDQEAVSKWMPQMPRCRLLITTRQQDWPSDMGLKIRPVNVFSPEKSRELLIKLASRLNEEAQADLDRIADRLGNLPLALDLAGRYLADRPGLKPKDYLKALDEGKNALDHSSLKDWVTHNPTEHATNLASTFALSWDRLSDDVADSLARRIFRICGYCAANTPIPVELLAKAAGTDESTEDMDRAMKRLSQLGMAILIDGRPVLHPLLAEFARMQDETEGVLPELADALIDLAAKADETGYPKQMEPLREHLEAVASIADRRNLQSASRLIGLLASHKEKTAEYDSARKLYMRALEVDEKANGQDHPSVATVVNNLGSVLQDLGDLQEARKCYERAIRIDEKVYGKDHPSVATDVNNLGLVLKDLGDLQEARKCFERALKIGEKANGPDHPSVAIRVNNLGLVLRAQGELQEARKCYERAIRIDEKANGQDHPSVATVVNNLGSVLQDLGDLQEARKCFERAIEIDEKVYGKDHPEVATDVNNLGLVLNDLGDLQEARKCYERAIKILRVRLGPDHPKTKTAANNLKALGKG